MGEPHSASGYETQNGDGNWSAPQAGDTVRVTTAGVTIVRFQAVDNVGHASEWDQAAAIAEVAIRSPSSAS